MALRSAAEYAYTSKVEAAALAGDIVAQSRLGTAYHEGLGTARDPEKALHWFTKAANAGHAGAACMVSAAYDTGTVVDQNLVLAAFYAYISKINGNELGGLFFDSVFKKLNDNQRREFKVMVEHNIRAATEAS